MAIKTIMVKAMAAATNFSFTIKKTQAPYLDPAFFLYRLFIQDPLY